MSNKIREALAGMLAIVDESRGVDGYHLSGDIAEWDTFPEVEIARSALAQQPAPAVPEGWKLVPVEPTREMWAAAGDCVTTLQWSGIGHHDKISSAVYRAMLAAAPAAPAAPAAQEPVAFYWQDLETFPLTTRRHGPYFGWPSEDAIARCQHYAKPIPLYTAPPAAEQPNHVERNLNMVEQPDTVKVPRLLLTEALEVAEDVGHDGLRIELRALLGKEGEA